jgi:hypothetical protein
VIQCRWRFPPTIVFHCISLRVLRTEEIQLLAEMPLNFHYQSEFASVADVWNEAIKKTSRKCFGSERSKRKKLGDNSNLFIVVSRRKTEILLRQKRRITSQNFSVPSAVVAGPTGNSFSKTKWQALWGKP